MHKRGHVRRHDATSAFLRGLAKRTKAEEAKLQLNGQTEKSWLIITHTNKQRQGMLTYLHSPLGLEIALSLSLALVEGSPAYSVVDSKVEIGDLVEEFC
ncbi:hypothetical protein L6164_002137 [Bauhinia variegata]|uniref:Uncharacterized protein n=1 Tax=Bauhinia variegata TaxID=167791 RepID=A0ACB9PX93_BAUVA|nr:hypothetical protein L6164_002137 [Bauhinia variegata]